MALGDITIETSFSRPFSFNVITPEQGSEGNILKILKPKITYDYGLGPKVFAPYGEPDNYGWVALAILGILVFFALRGIR